MSFADTSTFPTAITFSNGLYKLFQATNSNFNHIFAGSDINSLSGSTNANIIYIHGVPIDWTLISPALGGTRQATIDAIIALNTSPAVSVTQVTSPWVVSGTVTASAMIPASADIIGASRTTTGTLVVIPAGRTFVGSMSLSNSISVAGNNQPTISVSGAGALPAGTLHQIVLSGLALSTAASANTIGNVYIYGGSAGGTVTFTTGASGISTGQITGRLL